jgi:hypothetical protein
MSSTSRKVLAIVGCQVLEDEIVHVISIDPTLSKVIIVKSAEAKSIYDKMFHSIPDKEVVLVPPDQVSNSLPEEGESVIVRLLPISLHQISSELRDVVMNEIANLQKICNGVLVFYGMCGNTFLNIDRMAADFSIPVVILRDEQDRIIDDCIGAVLGGTDEYLDFLRKDRGGYPLNHMWASNWRYFMRETQLLRDDDGLEEVKMVFQCMGYSKVVKLDTGIGDRSEYDKDIREFARIFGFEIESVPCTTKVVESCYQRARMLLGA